MAGTQLKAFVIVVLLGNFPQQARLFWQSLGGMGTQGGMSMCGLGLQVNTLGNQLARWASWGGAHSANYVRAQRRSRRVLTIWKAALGPPTAAMENYTIRLNSLNHNDKAKTDVDIQWAVKNAMYTTSSFTRRGAGIHLQPRFWHGYWSGA